MLLFTHNCHGNYSIQDMSQLGLKERWNNIVMEVDIKEVIKDWDET